MPDLSPLSKIDPGLEVARFEADTGRYEAFARVIVVRVIGAAASKPGDRYIVRDNGELIGFVGGGCVRGAVERAGRAAIDTGKTQLVRTVPAAKLDESEHGSNVDIVPNGCPSEGEIEFFVEPVLPQPPLVVFGQSRLADAIAELGAFSGLSVFRECDDANVPKSLLNGFCIVASQGRGDVSTLTMALRSDCPIVFFIASKKKATHIKTQLRTSFDAARLEKLISPAGLDIGASTPAEIAISIIAQIIALRRKPECAQ